MPLFKRVAEHDREPVPFLLDGQPARGMRGDTLLCEGTEVRAFCERDPADASRIRAIPVPEDIKALCS